MRVITGFAKKKPLLTLNEKTLRPTTARVKEAMFSIIQFEIENKVVLDLFSGSGQLGIEALSRGAKSCTFVDCSPKAHKIEIENLKNTNLNKNARVIISNALTFLKNTKNKYDIIILDPPYKENMLCEALNLAQYKTSPNGIIICEHLKSLELNKTYENIILQKQYDYGKIRLSFFKNKV